MSRPSGNDANAPMPGPLPKKEPHGSPLAGLVRFFAHHRTAANLLMIAMLLLGFIGVQKLNTQFFPTIEFPQVSVTVTWEGATPSDMERSVIRNL